MKAIISWDENTNAAPVEGRRVAKSRYRRARRSVRPTEHVAAEILEPSHERSVHHRVAHARDHAAEDLGLHDEVRDDSLTGDRAELLLDRCAHHVGRLARDGDARVYAPLNLVDEQRVLARDLGNQMLAAIGDHRAEKAHEESRQPILERLGDDLDLSL